MNKPTLANVAGPEDRLVSRAEIARHYAVSKMTVYHWMRQGRIPQPIRLSPRCIRWRWSEILAAMEGRKAA
jgi:prophage regulatory protein